MERRIIWRGVLSGAIGGVLAFVWAKVFLEPIIGRSIDFEDATADAHARMSGGAHEHGIELFSRDVQSTIGMGLGVLAFGVAMGALFAVVFCAVHGRVAGLSTRALSALIAGAMLVALWIVPALKYPPNPPATSLTETITQRALLYLLMMGLSAALMVAAAFLGNRLAPRWGAWNAWLSAAGAYLVAVSVVMLVLPTIDETPGPLRDARGTIVLGGYPAGDLYAFRLDAAVTQVILWAAIGLCFGAMAAKLLDERREPVPA